MGPVCRGKPDNTFWCLSQQRSTQAVAAAAQEAPDAMASVAQLLAGRHIAKAAALATSVGDVRLSLLILQVQPAVLLVLLVMPSQQPHLVHTQHTHKLCNPC